MILAFDIRVEREAQEYADSVGVHIFSADIIYHLFDKFLGYREVSCVCVLLACRLQSATTGSTQIGVILGFVAGLLLALDSDCGPRLVCYIRQ